MGDVVSWNLGKCIINMGDWVYTGNNNGKEIQLCMQSNSVSFCFSRKRVILFYWKVILVTITFIQSPYFP